MQFHIGGLLATNAAFRPHHPAFSFEKQHFTYAEYNRRVNRLANAILATGVKKGEKLATILPNCIPLMDIYWACAKTGVVVVPMSPLLMASGLQNLLDDSDTVIVFADQSHTATLDRIRETLPKIADDSWILVNCDGDAPEGFRTFEDLTDGSPETTPPDPDLKSDDVYNIVYSSGTTGQPKGIIHTHFVRANYCSLFANAWRMTPESVVLHAGAIIFNGAFLDLMPWMYLGCHYILHPTFDAKRVMDEIEKSRVTHIIMVPAQIIQILDHPEFDPKRLESLEMIQSLGAPLHLEYKKRLLAALPDRFYELYGLTEGFMTVLDKNDSERKMGSVGSPVQFYEMKICDADGREVPTGEIGEIVGRGPMMMPGYYKRDALTAETIRDGWLYSGDLGYVDEDGYLYLVDRKKDLIISGGVNVYPKDIEEIMVAHPDLQEVAVFGAASEKWGETPVAAVVMRSDIQPDPEAIKAWTNERVAAKFQRITDVIILDAFPRNAAGKTLKREIRDDYEKARHASA